MASKTEAFVLDSKDKQNKTSIKDAR